MVVVDLWYSSVSSISGRGGRGEGRGEREGGEEEGQVEGSRW